MAQPIVNNEPLRISGTGAGTSVISNEGANLNTITIGANFTGTATFYNSATGVGTTAGNLLIAINNNSGSVPVTITPHVWCRNGITAVVGGTTDILVGWSK